MNNHQSRGTSHRARGLTLVEVIIGTSIMGLVMMALASFTTAVAAGWKHSEQINRTSNVGVGVAEQLQSTIGNTLAVVYTKQGSAGTVGNAYLFYWKQDSYNANADSKAQFGEMGLIEYDATSHSLYLYEPKASGDLSAGQANIAKLDNWSGGNPDTVVDYYKSSGVAKTRTRIAGPDESGRGSQVNWATFSVYTPKNAKPTVTYDLSLSETGSSAGPTRTYGTATIKSSKTPKNIK